MFEAAGAAACLITDAWEGLEQFFEPGTEMLVARNGDEVAQHVQSLDAAKAKAVGQAAYKRVLAEHTYAHRAAQLDAVLEGRAHTFVVPAEAGTQGFPPDSNADALDSRLRGNDKAARATA